MPYRSIEEGLSLHYLDFPISARRPGSKTQTADGHLETKSKPVVLVHGLGASAYSWIPQIPPLTRQGYRVIAPDIRGYGQSDFADGKLSIATFATDLHHLLSGLQIDRFHLIGLSLGGAIALEYASKYPAQVEKLILINTAARFRPDSLSLAFYYLRRFLLGFTMGLDRQAEAVSMRIFRREDQTFLRTSLAQQIISADHRSYKRTILSLLRFDARGELARITAPTLVITGLDDSTVTPKMQTRLTSGIPVARQSCLPGLGHGLTGEAPDEANSLILDFLAE